MVSCCKPSVDSQGRSTCCPHGHAALVVTVVECDRRIRRHHVAPECCELCSPGETLSSFVQHDYEGRPEMEITRVWVLVREGPEIKGRECVVGLFEGFGQVTTRVRSLLEEWGIKPPPEIAWKDDGKRKRFAVGDRDDHELFAFEQVVTRSGFGTER